MDDELDDDDDESRSDGIPIELIKSYLAFAVRAISRRRLLIALVFGSVVALVGGAVAIWPRTYECEARLMAQQSHVLAQREGVADALKGASETITRRDNLEAITEQLDLLRLWRENRPPALRFKDRVMEQLRGPLAEKDLQDGLTWTLRDRIVVESSFGEGTITISATWSDGPTATRIVEAAIQNYLEDRHVAEISTIAEYVSILESHAAKMRGEVESIATQVRQLNKKKIVAERTVERVEEQEKTSKRLATIGRQASRGASAKPTDEELPGLNVMLEAKRRTIAQLQDNRNRQVLDLQTKLAELRTEYTEAHPAVLDARQKMAALSKESPQVEDLKAEVSALEQELNEKSARSKSSAGVGSGLSVPRARPSTLSAAEPLPPEIVDLIQESTDDLDPAVAAQLRHAVGTYSSLRSQISSARLDLDTAHAAFKHRYKVVLPPEAPDAPKKPKVALVMAAGIIAALFLALLAALAAELRTGKLVERWQVEALALPVLAELRLPPHASE